MTEYVPLRSGLPLADPAGALQIRLMSPLRALFFLLLLTTSFACRKDDPAQTSTNSSAATAPAPAVPSRFAATGWPEEAGPIVVLPASGSQEVRIVLPELSDKTLTDTSSFELDSLPNSAVSLFSPGGTSTHATIVGGGTEETPRGCKTWPTARLAPYPGNGWRFGLAENAGRDLPLLGWGSELTTDSVRAAAEVIRLAERNGKDSVFTGVPYAVRYLYRLELGASRIVVADAIRRINTEANVREQHTLIIAEKSGAASAYQSAFRETQSGREDDVRVPEILGAVLLGENRRAALFVSLEHSDGMRLLLIERQRAGSWSLRWRSAYTGC